MKGLKKLISKKKILEHDNYFLSRSGKPLTGVQIENIVKRLGEKAHVRRYTVFATYIKALCYSN